MSSLLVFSLLAAWQARSASARSPALPAALDGRALNRLVDGNASPDSDPVAVAGNHDRPAPPSYIIRAEQDPLPLAPRFSLIRAKNAGRRWGKIPEWTYDGRPNEPPWTCLSDAAGTGDAEYFLLPKFIEEDPVRHLAIPQQPRGYAELLIESGGYEVTDPVTDQVHAWTPGMSAMEGQYKELFAGSLLSERRARLPSGE